MVERGRAGAGGEPEIPVFRMGYATATIFYVVDLKVKI
jgi:hypothetical protein